MTNKPDSEYTLGLDLSKYDCVYNDYTEKITDIWKLENSSKRIDFVIQRVSYGIRQDQFVNELYEQVKKVAVRGAYHYFTSGLGWQKQLSAILESIKNKEYHFFAIDYEKIYNTLDRTSFAEMMELVKQLKLATKKKVLIYFNADVYNNYMKPFGADNVINLADAVWFAQYPYKEYLDLNNLPPLLPKNIKNCKFFQFAGDVQGTRGYLEGKDWGTPAKSVDINLFYGSIKDLQDWAEVDGSIITPPPPVEKSRYTGSVLWTTFLGLQVRESPITGLKVARLNPTQSFEGDVLVTIQNEKWLHVTKPHIGWISAKYTRYVDNGIIEPPPVNKVSIPGPFRLLSDMDLGITWESRFENAKLLAYPATINVSGGKGQIQLSTSYLTQLKRINNSAQWNRMWTDEHGWHNKPHGEIGRVQQLTFAHSDIWVTGEDADFYYIDAYYNNENCPDLVSNYDKYRINIFSIMSKNDAKNNGGIFYDDTGHIKTLLIANDKTEKLKIEKKYCKSLISLPVDCKVKTGRSSLYFRKYPVDGEIFGSYKNGTSVTVLEFTKVSNRVWGKTKDGWIAMWLTDLDV